MLKRASERWRSASHSERPRVLVEDPNGAFRNADFRAFEQAGFDVALCTGPDADTDCPLHDSQRCGLVERADVILFGLGTTDERSRAVLRALRTHYPETPVVVEVPRERSQDDAHLPEGCLALAFPASIDGQTRVLWEALAASEAGKRSAQRRAHRPSD